MSNEVRGSEKLKATCTGMSVLSEEELERVIGGYSFAVDLYKPFPKGIPWPDLLNAGGLSVDPIGGADLQSLGGLARGY